ncbi:MAG: hypothetical protein HYV07_01415 [Deltaproteobacteria bacterium]|nr:hypothetical protein [Deltaproteobacteria bacterium]
MRPRDVAGLYALKARLQSLLVRTHPDALDPSEVPGKDGVVSLNRALGGDACHAVVDQLDDDARTWVLEALEAKRASRTGPKRPARSSERTVVSGAGSDLIDQGAAALDEYDYETARACFERAVRESAGSPRAVAALLGLLVQTLGADEEAATLEPRLSEAARGDPEIRVLLALASARRGARDSAVRWLRSTTHAGVGDVLAELVRRALSEGDLTLAANDLKELRRQPLPHPAIGELEASLKLAQLSKLRDEELTLSAELNAGSFEDAEARARAILAAWPASSEARRALTIVSSRKADAELSELLSQAAESEPADPARSARLLRRAIELRADPGLEARARELELRAEAAEDERRVTEVVDQLPTQAGLLAYLELNAKRRSAVRIRSSSSDLARLDAMISSVTRLKPAEAIAALQALDTAREQLGRGDFEAAKRSIRTHEAYLRSLPELEPIHARIHELGTSAGASRAVDELARLEAAIADESIPELDLKNLESHLAALPSGLLTKSRELLARYEEVTRARKARDGLHRLIAEGKWFDARAAQEALAAQLPNLDLQSETKEIADRLLKLFGFRDYGMVSGDRAFPDGCGAASRDAGPECWLSGDGRALVVPALMGNRAFVRVMDLETKSVHAYSFRFPNGRELGDFVVDGSVATIADASGAALRFAWAEAMPLSFTGPMHQGLEFLTPESDAAWFEDDNEVSVVVLGRPQSRRKLRGDGCLARVLGDPHVGAFIQSWDDGRLSIFSHRGAEIDHPRQSGPIRGVVTNPTAPGLIGLCIYEEDGDELPELELAELPPGGRVLASFRGDTDSGHTLAAVKESRILALKVHTGEAFELITFGADPGESELARVAISSDAVIAQDAKARFAVALTPSLSGLELAPITREPSRLRVPERTWVPHLSIHWCFGEPNSQSEHAESLAAVPPEGRAREFRSVRAKLEADGDVAGLSALTRSASVWRLGLEREATSLRSWLDSHHADHPEVASGAAWRAAKKLDWRSVRRSIERALPNAPGSPTEQHLLHLLGLALLATGELAEARTALERALRLPGKCDLDDPIALLAALEATEVALTHGAVKGFRAFVAAIRRADAALERGDVEAALHHVDEPAIWQGREIESLARLAQASLESEPVDSTARLRRDLAVATYLQARSHRDAPLSEKILLPGISWDRTRHEELATRSVRVLRDDERTELTSRELPVPAPGPASLLSPYPETHPDQPTETPPTEPLELAVIVPIPETQAEAETHPESDRSGGPSPTVLREVRLASPRRRRLAHAARGTRHPEGGEPRGPLPDELRPSVAPGRDLIEGLSKLIALEHERELRHEGLRLGWRFRRVARDRLNVDTLLHGESPRPLRLPFESLLASRELASLPQDRAALALVASAFRAGAELPQETIHRILFELAGHPRISWVGPRGSTNLEVVRGVAELAVTEPEPGVLSLSLSVDGELSGWSTAAASGGLVVAIDEERARALVAELKPILARLLCTFPAGFGERVEAGREAALLELLSKLERQVPVSWRAALKGPSIAANDSAFFLLEAAGASALSIEVRVRPLAGGPSFVAGTGLDEVVGRRPDASVHHTIRDFGREIESARSLLERVPEELKPPRADSSDSPGSSWLLLGQSALRLVSFLDGAGLPVEWAGDAWVIRRSSERDLRIQAHDGPNWFGITGELTVQADRVKLALLLAAGREERKFVPLGAGRWAELSEHLQRTLAALGDILEPDEAGHHVAHELAPVLADLGDGSFVPSPDLRATLARLRSRAALPLPLESVLRPYQREGVRRLANLAAFGAGACLADDMGLGKTVQAISLLLARRHEGPALVVGPASLGFNWVRELRRFGPDLSVTHLRAMEAEERPRAVLGAGPNDVLVASYDLVVRDADLIASHRFATLVLDEAQAIKNPRARRAKAVQRIRADWRLALTGTPLENRLADLWSIFRAVAPNVLGPWARFRERFAAPIERGREPSRMRSLSRLLAPFVVRRTKSQVLPELPPKTEVTEEILLSPAERALYEDVRLAAVQRIAKLIEENVPIEQRRFSILGALTELRQAACHPRLLDRDSEVSSSKEARLLELVTELKAEGRRTLVFSQFVRHLALVKSALEVAGVSLLELDGSTPNLQRQARVDQFQTGEVDVFLISLKAGGVGLNLTAADTVIHIDPWWNPATEDQASDRAHRIGQTKPVTVFRLVARGTVEDAIMGVHAEKRDRLVAFFEGVGRAEILDELVKLMGRGVLPEDNAEVEDSGEEPD